MSVRSAILDVAPATRTIKNGKAYVSKTRVQVKKSLKSDSPKTPTTKKSSVKLQASVRGYRGLEAFHKYWGKKPVESWNILIEKLSNEGDCLMDPFLGTGLVARESVLKMRNFIGIDINPISVELTNFFLNTPESSEVEKAFTELELKMSSYLTKHYEFKGSLVTHILWQNQKVLEYWIKTDGKKVTKKPDKAFRDKFSKLKKYKIKNFDAPTFFDNPRINTHEKLTINDIFTDRALGFIDKLIGEINNIESVRVRRAMKLLLSSSVGQMSNMVFAVTGRGKTTGLNSEKVEVGSWAIGYWRPETHFEVNPWNCFLNKKNTMVKGLKDAETKSIVRQGKAKIILGDSEVELSKIKAESVQLILTDPPHGDRIPYLELSSMWNSILGFSPNFENELVVSNAKSRQMSENKYTEKFSIIMNESHRILKKGGFMAVMFNSRNEEHWSALTGLRGIDQLTFVGRYDMKYSAGSIVQDNRDGGLKTDYVLVFGKDLDATTLHKTRRQLSLLPSWSIQLPGVENAS